MYSHIISLGHFCGTASELERVGLRGASYPFDWVISDLDGVLSLMENGFKEFLEVRYMQQSATNRSLFHNTKYDIQFFHDFDKYTPMVQQIDSVREKYDRRIARLYRSIKEPTLFVRYVSDQQEGEYLSNSKDHVNEILLGPNSNNSLLLVANRGISLRGFDDIYVVDPDQNDSVARKFLDANSELMRFLTSDIYDSAAREENIRLTIERKPGTVDRLSSRAKSALKKVFLKEKVHDPLP